MQWEYAGEEFTITTYLRDPFERCLEMLNKMGEEGWEMVCSVATFDPERDAERVFAVFKRPRLEERWSSRRSEDTADKGPPGASTQSTSSQSTSKQSTGT
jgi:hypothetical protein